MDDEKRLGVYAERLGVALQLPLQGLRRIGGGMLGGRTRLARLSAGNEAERLEALLGSFFSLLFVLLLFYRLALDLHALRLTPRCS